MHLQLDNYQKCFGSCHLPKSKLKITLTQLQLRKYMYQNSEKNKDCHSLTGCQQIIVLIVKTTENNCLYNLTSDATILIV